jgi:hypothetical protein
MKKEKIRKFLKSKKIMITLAFLGLVFLSRFLFMGADLPSASLEIEEKAGGYNARNAILLGRWSLYQNWYQPMVYMPLQNFLSYISFSFFGVGLPQLRFPVVLLGFVGLVIYYIILVKQTNWVFALLGLAFYGFNFTITLWNRSALSENLSLFLMPLAIYCLTGSLGRKGIFVFIFLSVLNLSVKADGFPFVLAALSFVLLYSLKTKSFCRSVKASVVGMLAAGLAFAALIVFLNAHNHFFPFYRLYFGFFTREPSFFGGILSSLEKLVSVLLSIDPFLFLGFLISLPFIILERRKLNRIDGFMASFLLLSFLTRVKIQADVFSWKRVIYLLFPMVYFIIRSIYLLFEENKSDIKTGFCRRSFWEIIAVGFYSPLLLFFFFVNFHKPINFLFEINSFGEVYQYTLPAFILLSFIVFLTAIAPFGLAVFNGSQKLRRAASFLILFFVWSSLIPNTLRTVKLFIPDNLRYSYAINRDYASLIPEGEIVVAHEQAMRALAYLSRHDFYFNHDGSHNPVPYREIFERQDLRYFILNAEEFWRERWGMSNKARLQAIFEAYPKIRHIGVFPASKVMLAIYDKYDL